MEKTKQEWLDRIFKCKTELDKKKETKGIKGLKGTNAFTHVKGNPPNTKKEAKKGS